MSNLNIRLERTLEAARHNAYKRYSAALNALIDGVLERFTDVEREAFVRYLSSAPEPRATEHGIYDATRDEPILIAAFDTKLAAENAVRVECEREFEALFDSPEIAQAYYHAQSDS